MSWTDKLPPPKPTQKKIKAVMVRPDPAVCDWLVRQSEAYQVSVNQICCAILSEAHHQHVVEFMRGKE
jgi:predicted HicB family RNase H-like nuclease